jgi:Arc/MetJ-type ribon-helix-helix transcriptional regulator
MDALPQWQDKSDAVRAALRLYFGLNGEKQQEQQNIEPIKLEMSATPIDAENKLDNLLGDL